MDQNNKHLMQSFPTAFFNAPGIPQSTFMALQQMSGLSNPMLHPSGLGTSNDLSQWTQSNTQQWIDPAKMAAMLPMYFSSVKGLGLGSTDLLTQSVTTSSSSSIFPQSNFAGNDQLSHHNVAGTSGLSHSQEPSNENPLSNNPSSHHSTATPQDIDVGCISQPHSQSQAYDLTMRESPIINNSSMDNTTNMREGIGTHHHNMPSTSTAEFNATMNDSFPDLDNIDGSTLFMANQPRQNGHTSTSKENTQEDEKEAYDLFFADFIEHKQNTSNNTEFGFDDSAADDINDFGAVEFTPPDSPVEQVKVAETDSLANLFIPSASCGQMTNEPSTSFQSSSAISSAPQPYQRAYDFKPSTSAHQPPTANYKKEPVYSRPTKISKVPVYKQKVSNMIMPDDEEIDVKNVTDINDAYSFDDEEDFGLLPIETKEKVEVDPNEFWRQQIAAQKKKNIAVAEQLKAPPTPVATAALLPMPAGIINEFAEEIKNNSATAPSIKEEPEIIILSESLLQRRKNRIMNEFINTIPSGSRECAREESGDTKPLEKAIKQEIMDQPPIPKLVIKRVSIDDYPRERKKKRKKRKKREDDSDWEGTDQAKRRKLRRHKRLSSEYEVHVVERDDRHTDGKPMLNMLSKKQRFLNQWEEAQQQEQRDKENGANSSLLTNSALKNINYDPAPNGAISVMTSLPVKQEFNSEAVKQRLSKFGSAEGYLPKGTFVVLKSDLFSGDESAALWRVDNQSMLQKYIPKVEPLNGHITYQSSSVYSGWCESIAHDYYRVATKTIKQSRSEAIVEPEIPLSDLFPAMTSEAQDDNGYGTSEEESFFQHEALEDHNAILRDPIRLSMHTFIQAMIVHAFTLSHFQELRAKNDWNFQKAEDDIEDMTNFCLMNLRSWANMSEAIEDYLCTYTQMAVIKAEKNLTEVCQSCEAVTVEKVVQLFSKDQYDDYTLEYLEQSDQSDFLPSFELLVCSTCAMVTCLFHKCYHLRFILLKECEEKLEEVEQQYPEYSAEMIIDTAKKDKIWITAIINEYIDIWNRAQGTEEDILGGKCPY